MTKSPTRIEDAARFQFRIKYDPDTKKALYTLLTPMNYSAYNWGLTRLASVVRWGKSYVLSEERGKKLRNFLIHKEKCIVDDEPFHKPQRSPLRVSR